MAILSKKHQSIELLTEEESQKSASSKKTFLIVLVLVIVGQLLLYPTTLFLNFNARNSLNEVNEQIQAKSQAQGSLSPVVKTLQTIKNKLVSYNQLEVKYTGTDERIQKITNLLPQDVVLLTFTITSTGSVILDGSALNSEAAYEFYQVLSKEEGIKDLRLSSIAKSGSDYRFNVGFSVK